MNPLGPDDLHHPRFTWWRDGDRCIIASGERFDGQLATYRKSKRTKSRDEAVVELENGGLILCITGELRRPRGVFPRDDFVHAAEYDGDSCPRDSYERWFFLRLLDEDVEKQVGCASAFCAFMHLHRRTLLHTPGSI